jgi:cation diffusion facilitator family transporter
VILKGTLKTPFKLIKMDSNVKQGEKAAILAGTTTLFFALSKLIIGIIAGSVVLIADSIHSFSDTIGTIIAWIGLKISQKKATKKFRYGYYKAESIAAFIISGFILYAAYEIISTSYRRLFILSGITIPIIAISVAILDGIFMFSVGTYEIKVGKKTHSQSLISDGRESRTHLFSSSVVLIGIIATILKIPYMEGIAGIIIGIIIIREGIGSLKDSTFSLMDISPDKEIEKKIIKILRKEKKILKFRDLKLRKAGMYILGELTIMLKKGIKVSEAHKITEKIEEKIKFESSQIESIVIHTEPFKSKKQKIIIPIKKRQGLNSEIIDHFGRAENLMFIELNGKKLENFYYKKNPHLLREVRAGLNLIKDILKENPDILITKQVGRISFHSLRDNLVELYHTEDSIVKDALNNYLKDNLKPLEEPTKEKD